MVRFAGSLHGALDRLADTPTWSMSPAEQREALVELARAEARVVELRLRVLVDADRNQVGADSGATSTPAWLAHATKTTTAGRGSGTCTWRRSWTTGSTATRRALAAGLIDVEKAADRRPRRWTR